VCPHVLHRGQLPKYVRALQMTKCLNSLTCSPTALRLLYFLSDVRADCFGEIRHMFPVRWSICERYSTLLCRAFNADDFVPEVVPMMQ